MLVKIVTDREELISRCYEIGVFYRAVTAHKWSVFADGKRESAHGIALKCEGNVYRIYLVAHDDHAVLNVEADCAEIVYVKADSLTRPLGNCAEVHVLGILGEYVAEGRIPNVLDLVDKSVLELNEVVILRAEDVDEILGESLVGLFLASHYLLAHAVTVSAEDVSL